MRSGDDGVARRHVLDAEGGVPVVRGADVDHPVGRDGTDAVGSRGENQYSDGGDDQPEAALKLTHIARVIESLPKEAAGFGNCVQQYQRPARRCFGQRRVEDGGYRDSTVIRASRVRVSAGVRRVRPPKRGRTRVDEPPDLFRGFLDCYYENVYGTRPVTRELQHGLVWDYCGLDKPPSRDTIDRSLTDLEHVIDDLFDGLVEQAAARGLLDLTYSIDSTHVEAVQYNDAASWNYDPTAEEHYYGFGCTIVSTGAKTPIAAEFTQGKQADQATAVCVTRDALAVDTPVWML